MQADDDARVEARVRLQLDALSVPYEAMECDPDFADTAAFCARYGYPLDASANTIIVAARREASRACACVVLASTRLDVNRSVCALLGVRRASFASEALTRELTAMSIGGVTPFGLPSGLPLYIDSRVMSRQWVIVGGGSRSLKLKVPPASLTHLDGARAVDGLAKEAEP